MPVKKIPSETGNAALDLALDTIKIGKQALVFANTKRSAEKTAEDIAKKVSEYASNKRLLFPFPGSMRVAFFIFKYYNKNYYNILD